MKASEFRNNLIISYFANVIKNNILFKINWNFLRIKVIHCKIPLR